MRKIPTVFERDHVTHKVVPVVKAGCEWVLAGEGRATRKYDGTCVMLDSDGWWVRRTVKPGKAIPETFVPVETDPVTGITVGWEDSRVSSYSKHLAEAIENAVSVGTWLEHGTYELCGPKVNGNPEDFDLHEIIRHGQDTIAVLTGATTYFGLLRDFMSQFTHEGIVWWHPDGRMAKLKVRDFT